MHLCVSNFNTSHVNVNPYRAELLPDFAVISIHLMLMLIVRILFLYFYQVHFNTSHVNVNQRSMGYKRIPKGISIHLMLMLILGF